MELSKYSIHAFIQEHDIKTERGEPLEFHDHRFLFDIYADNSPYLCEMKAAQLGLTTMELIRALYRAYYQHLDIIDVLPTFTDIQDLVGGKLNRIVGHNPIFQKWVKDKDSVEQKRIGGSTIYYRGSWNERQALMIAADWLILDEFDRSNQDVLEQYESRLQHSKYGYKSVFSNPSFGGMGVHKFFLLSDQKKWVIKHSCGKEYVLDERCIDYEQEEYICFHCKDVITDEERRMGDWRPTAISEGGWSGYWLPLWINPRVKASKIAEYKRTKEGQYFANFVAGLPYVNSENRITSDVVLKNVTPQINEQQDRIIIGVDPGTPIYFSCMNKQGVFYYGSCSLLNDQRTPQDPWDDIRKLLKRWPTAIVMVDGNGDSTMQRRLQLEFPGRVYLVFYRKDRKTKEMMTWGERVEIGTVRVDRNQYFQWMVEQLRDVGRIPLNGTVEEWQDWAKNFDNVYREIKTALDKPGKDVATNYGVELIWKRNGADHYCHTLLFCLTGLERFGNANASFIKRDKVMFPRASMMDNRIPARRVLGKKVQGYLNNW